MEKRVLFLNWGGGGNRGKCHLDGVSIYLHAVEFSPVSRGGKESLLGISYNKAV